MEVGPWSMVFGPWCLVLGFCNCLHLDIVGYPSFQLSNFDGFQKVFFGVSWGVGSYAEAPRLHTTWMIYVHTWILDLEIFFGGLQWVKSSSGTISQPDEQ